MDTADPDAMEVIVTTISNLILFFKNVSILTKHNAFCDDLGNKTLSLLSLYKIKDYFYLTFISNTTTNDNNNNN